MNTAAESVPLAARAEAVGDGDALVRRPKKRGTAASVVAQVPIIARAGRDLTGELAKVVVGRSDVEPDRRDARFADPTWTGNPGYHRLMQGYLATPRALGGLAEHVELSDWHKR